MGRKRRSYARGKSPPTAAKRKKRGEAATRTGAGSGTAAAQDDNLGDACPYGQVGKDVHVKCVVKLLTTRDMSATAAYDAVDAQVCRVL